MIEKEIWGIISSKTVNKTLESVEKKFGKPVISKRLSIEISDWNNKALDTYLSISHDFSSYTNSSHDF
jgi:hypothetical protein